MAKLPQLPTTPADQAKVSAVTPPSPIDTAAATPAERHCAKCGVVLAEGVPCPKHEQACPNCGRINLRNNGTCKCSACGFALPPLPEIIEVAHATQAPVSGSITLPPTEKKKKPAGLSPAEQILLDAEEADEKPVIMADPPPPPPNDPPPPPPPDSPEKKAKEWMKGKPDGKGKPAADTVKVPPLPPPPADEDTEEEEELPPVTPPPEGGPEHGGSSKGVAQALLLIIVLLLGGIIGYLLNKREPVVIEKEKVVTVTKEVAGPTKVVEKIVEAPKPKTKKVHRRSRPAPEKEITFRAEDLVHVWHEPVDHFLDKDDD